ncbi:MAG: diguanylate cyclase domain-containing protein [Nitrospiraceae bacterium]
MSAFRFGMSPESKPSAGPVWILMGGLMTAIFLWFGSDHYVPDSTRRSEQYTTWKIAGLSLLSATCLVFAWLSRESTSAARRLAGKASATSTYDSVTGLPTKRLFTTLVNQALSRTQRTGRQVAVLMIDLDHFTLSGDLQGQVNSNMIYRVQAARVKSALRSSDTVARMGERSFAVLLDNMTGSAEVVAIAKKMQATVSLPFTLEGHELFLTSRIGFELSSPESEAAGLLDAATQAVA